MVPGRRTVLALTGALLAGAAGCLESDEAGEGDENDATATESPATESTDPESTNTESEGDSSGDENGFDEYDVPDFPELDLTTDPDIDEVLLAEQVRGNVSFTLDLLDRLREDEPDGNLFFSPCSVSVALAMTYAGARAETAEEMADALRYELDQDDLHPAFAALEEEFARRNEDGEDVDDPTGDDHDGPAFQLSTANSTWGEEGYPFDDGFLELLEAYYVAGMQLADFSGSPEEARETINEWVEARTNDRIEDLLPESSISESTKLVLTNAIYFVAMWKYPFSKGDTEPAPFTGRDGEEVEVDTMHQSIEVPYAEIAGHQLVELPYANDDTSMVIVLPAEGEFESFEEEFSVDRLATLLAEASVPEVELSLPKFGIESKFSLVEVMEELGMERAFTSAADFSGMTGGDNGLFVSEIVHQSFVEVDELGTEAAAATAVMMDDSAPPDRVEMTVGRPFLFYIRDRPTETPLFVGRVVDGETLRED